MTYLPRILPYLDQNEEAVDHSFATRKQECSEKLKSKSVLRN